MPIKVVTNNVPRELIEGDTLTEKERKEFDYLDWRAIDAGEDSASFFRYKGDLIDLGTVIALSSGSELSDAGWEGIVSWSYSNGLVTRFVYEQGDALIVVGYFYVTGE